MNYHANITKNSLTVKGELCEKADFYKLEVWWFKSSPKCSWLNKNLSTGTCKLKY